MKNDPLTTFLNFVLAALVILGVGFTLLTIKWESNLRDMTTKAAFANTYMTRANALLQDVAAYNSKVQSPELTRAIQAVAQKPNH